MNTNTIRAFLIPAFVFFSMSGVVRAEADYFMGTEIGSSARGIRWGGVEGFSSNADSVFENPAALYRVSGTSLSVFATQLMGEVSYYNGAVAMGTDFGDFGIGFNTVVVDGLARTKLVQAGLSIEYPEQVGTFAVSKSVYKLAYSIAQSDAVHFGIGASYFTTQIDYITGSGYNFDTGIIYDVDGFGVSVFLRNLASGLKVDYSNKTSEVLPLETVVSTRLLFGDIAALGQMRIIGTSKKLAKSGALNYTPSFIPFISLSGGYKEFPVLDEVRGKVSLGLGINVFGNHFDYAYEHSNHPEYSGVHYFSLALNM